MAKRFFVPDSFWNTPIPKDAEIDPRSEEMLEILRSQPNEGEKGFWLNLHKWTIPVYEVDENTPRQYVLPDKEPFSHGKCFENPVPIPDYATPDPQRDAHMAIVDWKNMKAWDMWYVYRDENGRWRSRTGMTYRLDGSGVFDPEELQIKDGDSAHYYGPSRAAAVPAIAGLVMYDEIMEGRIRHKLAFATSANAYKEFVYPPACWTDGKTPGGLPEGCVIQLDPNLDLSKFNLKPAALVIARALQEYGAVNVDVSGGKTLYGEGLYSHPSKSWEGILEENDLECIGLSHFRVLKIDRVVKMGDERKRRRQIFSSQP